MQKSMLKIGVRKSNKLQKNNKSMKLQVFPRKPKVARKTKV